jgi:cytosine permease
VASAIAYFSPGIKPSNGIVAAAIIYFVLFKLMPQVARGKSTE